MKFTAFGQPQQQQQTSIFGGTNPTGTASLFGGQQAPSFGAAKPPAFGFGQTQQPSTSLFSSNQGQQQQTSLFGQTGTTNTSGGGLFGGTVATSFGQPSANQQSGTAIVKFIAPQETDTLLKGSTTSYVQTKQQCITFMKEYAEKSLEELRIEDYAANRKGPQAGAGLFASSQTGVFGSTLQQPQTNSLFGAQQNTQPTAGIFGSTGNTLGGGKAEIIVCCSLCLNFSS